MGKGQREFVYRFSFIVFRRAASREPRVTGHDIRHTIYDILKVCSIFSFLLLLPLTSHAAERTFYAVLENNSISPGRQTRIELIFPDENDMPVPDMPFMPGIEFRYAGVSKENGRTLHAYVISVSQEGKFQIGPLMIPYKGDVYRSNAVTLMVSKSAKSPAAAETKKETTAGPDISKRIFLELDVPKKEIYVNEKISAVLRLYSDWLDLEDVKVSEPLNKNIVSDKFVKGETAITEKNGTRYVVLNFGKSFFAPEPGEAVLDRADVVCDIVKRVDKNAKLLNANEDFYNGYLGRKLSRKLEMKTEPVSMKVVPLPAKGRPEGFNGAVGSFVVEIKEDMSGLKSKGIARFATKVTGTGNFNTVTMPALKLEEGVSLYDSKTEKKDGRVVFTQVFKVNPSIAREVPPLKYAFFDPGKGEYVSVQKGPFQIPSVGGGREEAAQKGEKGKTKAKEEMIGVKELSGRPYHEAPIYENSGLLILLEAFPLIILAAVVAEKRRIWVATSDSDKAVRIRAARKAKAALFLTRKLVGERKTKEFYDLVFNSLQEYLGERFRLAAGSITEGLVDEVVGTEKAMPETAKKIKDIFSDCYVARFTGVKMGHKDTETTLGRLREVFEELSKKAESRARINDKG